MAGLRENFGVALENPNVGGFVDEARANGMGSLRRGFETGRIGTELNPLHTEALQAEIDGELQRKAELDAQIAVLQQRQQRYAPQVGQLEDVQKQGIGSIPGYVAGQIGQGAASMIDPVAVSTGLGVAGRVLPGMLGKAAQGAAVLAPYLMSRSQLRGEQIGNQGQDQELMGSTTAQQRMDSAGSYANLAAIPDSAFPGLIGRQISGLSRATGAVARKTAMGAGLRTLGNMGVEGGTEALQSEMSHQYLGDLNPNRDTSGDAMENLNNFAGGALGSGPFAVAGGLAEAGHNRLGAGVDRVKDAAGSVVDLAQGALDSETGQKVAGKAKGLWGAGKDRAGSIMDLGRDDEGEITVGGVAQKAGDAVKKYIQSSHDLAVMKGDVQPPAGLDEAKMSAWFVKSDHEREALIGRTLTAMNGDPEAAKHIEAITQSPDQNSRLAALENAAGFLLGRHDETDTKAPLANWGEAVGSIAGSVGSIAGSAAKGAAGLVGAFAKGVVSGVKGKKNMQSELDLNSMATSDPSSPYDNWLLRTSRNGQTLADEAVGGLPTAAKQASRRRAMMFGAKLAAAATDNGHKDVAPAMRDMGHQIGEWAALDKAHQNLDAPGMQLAMSNVINNMVNTLGTSAGSILGEMERVSGPEHAALFTALKQNLMASRTTEGREMRRQMREDATNRLMELLPQKHFDEYSADPKAQAGLLASVERLAAGGYDRAIRDQIEQEMGKPRFLAMLNVVNNVAVESSSSGEQAESDPVSDFDKAAAEKKMSRSSGNSIYGFNGNLALRSQKDYKDIFATTKQMTKEEKAAAAAAGDESVNRPQLFRTKTGADGVVTGTQSLPSGDNTLEVNMQTMRDAVGYKQGRNPSTGELDTAFDETNGYEIGTASAHDLMNDHNVSPEKRLALYRDYLRMDAEKEQGLAKTKLSKQSSAVGRVLGKMMGQKEDGAAGPESWNEGQFSDWKNQLADAQRAGYKGSEDPEGHQELDAFDVARATKDAEAYFKNHHIVTASSTTDNDEQRLDAATALGLRKEGKDAESATRRDAAIAGKGDMSPQEASLAVNTVKSLANILYFPNSAGKDVPIKASDLVYWARSVKDSRGQAKADKEQTSLSPAKQNARYLEDLIDGLSAYAADHAVGMPYKFNAKGDKEHFTESGEFPKSLVLANAQYGDAVQEEGFRLTNKSPLGLAAQKSVDYENATSDARMSVDNQAEVEKDQDKNDEFFTAEQREEREPTLDGRKNAKRENSLTTVVRQDLGAAPDGRKGNGPIRVDRSGQVASEPKTSEYDRTELDFSKGQDSKAEPDEITAQQYFTEHATKMSAKYQSPTNALNAMSSARYNADGIMATMFNDPRAGDRDVVTLLRTALEPDSHAKSDRFDAYRIAPLIRLVSNDHELTPDGSMRKLTHAEYFENSGATPGLMNIVRRGAAQVLQRDSNMTDAHKLKLAKELLGNQALTYKEMVPALQAFLNKQGGRVTQEEMEVNWGDPSQMPEAPVMKAQPAIKPTPQAKTTPAAKTQGPGVMTDDEIDSMIIGKAPSVKEGMMAALEAAQAKEKVSDAASKAEAARRARNSAPLSANDQMVANAKARLGGQPNPQIAAMQAQIAALQAQLAGNTAEAAPAAAPAAPKVAKVAAPAPEGYVVKTPSAELQAKIDAKMEPGTSFLHAINNAITRATMWQATGEAGPGIAKDLVLLGKWSQLGEADAKAAAEGNNSPNTGRIVKTLQAGSTGSPLGKPSGARRNNQTAGQWMYHGTRAKDEMLVQPDGSLLLKPSKNYGGKTNGVSFTHDLASATDYATRVKGGGPDGFRFTGAKVLKINRAALANIEEETFGEWADYTGNEVVIPKGMYSIEPVARTRALLSDSYLMDGGGYSFKDYLKENYSSMERENLYQDDGLMAMTKEEYLDQVVDPDSESDVKDVAEAQAILNDEFGRKQNAQAPDGPAEATPAQMAAAQAWLNKVAPGTILKFIKETGYSGEYVEAQNLINVSTTAAAGILNTTYHEGLHKFFAQFVRSNPKLQQMFDSFVNDPRILARLNELLADYPAALEQLSDGEERLAYAFQFWKAGLLKVDNENRSFLQKVGAIFRRVFGMVRDSEHALAIFQAFDSGKLAEPSAAGRVIAAQMSKGATALKLRRGLDGVVQGLAAAVLPGEMILGENKHSAEARRLNKILFTNPGDEESGGGQVGYLNAKRSESKRFANQANQLFEKMDKGDVDAIQKHMQAQTELSDIKLGIHRDAVASLRKTLEEFHTYMREAGLKIGKVDKYYPTVWSIDALQKNKDAFIKMLVSKYAQQMTPDGGNAQKAAERIHAALIERNGVDTKALNATRDAPDANAPKAALREDGVLSPFFAGKEQQTLWWLDGADKEAYQSKNMPHTLSTYFHQGVRAAEYHRRFGESGIKLELSMKKIRAEIEGASNKMLAAGEIKNEADRAKWAGRQMRDISMAVGAIEGTLGKDISPNMRKFNSYMIAYQNIRLLPYMIFSSFVDPLAQVARGASLSSAMETFTYGMRAVFRSWADMFKDMPPERQKDEWTKIAEHIGAIEVAMFNHHVAEEYSSVYMSPIARKVNETLFKMNGMEAWDRANRTMATKWAVRFIEQHKGVPDRNHSARWLAELGLTPATAYTNAEGNLITTADELAMVQGISISEAKIKIAPIHAALNRWVEGAVISPNAAQRPGWSSDPNYAAVFHLKQFSYSFQQTIMKRAMNEMEHGNMKPITALAGFVPTMIAADLMKGLVQGAGTLPPYMAGLGPGEILMRGIERSGLGGVGDIGVHAMEDWSSLGGPGFEQAVDALRDDVGRTAVKALPLHAVGEYLYSGGERAVAAGSA